MTINELFTTETSGIEPVRPTSVVRLRDGGRFDLHIAPVRKGLDHFRRLSRRPVELPHRQAGSLVKFDTDSLA